MSGFRLLIPVGLGALLVLAVLGKSAVMAVSVVGLAVGLWATRTAPLRIRLVALAVGGLVGSLGAEAVHTAYHLLGGETASGDSGFFFASAFLVGAINVAVMGILVAVAHRLGRPAAAG